MIRSGFSIIPVTSSAYEKSQDEHKGDLSASGAAEEDQQISHALTSALIASDFSYLGVTSSECWRRPQRLHFPPIQM